MKAKIVTLFFILALIFLCHKDMHAQQYAIPADLSNQFMRRNDSRSIGMGSTGASYVTGIMAGYTNPAGLTGLENYAFALSYYPSNLNSDIENHENR